MPVPVWRQVRWPTAAFDAQPQAPTFELRCKASVERFGKSTAAVHKRPEPSQCGSQRIESFLSQSSPQDQMSIRGVCARQVLLETGEAHHERSERLDHGVVQFTCEATAFGLT